MQFLPLCYVKYLLAYTYKFLFIIGKKQLTFVRMVYCVYSEFRLLRRFPIVSVANFMSFCRYVWQSIQLSLVKL